MSSDVGRRLLAVGEIPPTEIEIFDIEHRVVLGTATADDAHKLVALVAHLERQAEEAEREYIEGWDEGYVAGVTAAEKKAAKAGARNTATEPSGAGRVHGYRQLGGT